MKSKTTSIFPDPEAADGTGLLCVGGELSPQILLDAYSHGIFPWPQEGAPLLWFSPPERGILDFEGFHIPRRFEKQRHQLGFQVTKNKAFSQVISSCARAIRKGEAGTWILPEMESAYLELHQLGYAHSYEAWRGGELVGGLYGIEVQGLFSGESMFFKESGASKICLIQLIEDQMAKGRGWVDIQMVTPVLKTFGGAYIPRREFLNRLAVSKR